MNALTSHKPVKCVRLLLYFEGRGKSRQARRACSSDLRNAIFCITPLSLLD
jgi:hypothetical protein